MKLKPALRSITKTFWRIAAPIAAAEFLLCLLFGWLARDNTGFRLLYNYPFISSLLLFFYIAVTFREHINFAAQSGISRESTLACGFYFLIPTAFLLALAHAVAIAVILPSKEPDLLYGAGSTGWLLNTTIPATAFWRSLLFFTLEALRYGTAGAVVGALLYRIPRKSRYWLIPVALLGLLGYFFGRFALELFAGEGGSLPDTLYTELLYHQYSAFPFVGECVRNLASTLIYGSIAVLAIRNAPIQEQ